MKHILFALCGLLCVSIPASAQKLITGKQWKKTTRVFYSYDCGPLPEQHKIDYSISVDKDSIIVNIYTQKGTKRVAYASTSEKFNSVKSQLAAMGLGEMEINPDEPRPRGGDEEGVTCYAGDQAFFGASMAKGYGTLYVKQGSPRAAFTSVLPVPISQIIKECTEEKETSPQQIYVSEEDMANASCVRYSFSDSSTPPRHHRSYTISIEQDSIVVEVWSYGNQLLHTVYPFTERQFMKVKRHLYQQGISKDLTETNRRPSGGKNHTLSFYRDGKCFFSASRYSSSGVLHIKKGTAIEAFNAALPEPIETIVRRTRQ